MKTGIFIGRFNPPHKGHISLIKNLLKRVDKLIVIIGNSKEKNTKKNPFSGKERIQMIKTYLKEEKIPKNKVQVLKIRPGKTWKEKIENLLKTCRNCDVLFTNNKHIINIIGDEIKVQSFRRIGKVSSTKIKHAIHKNKKWEHHTGKSVVKIINQINGIKRIKKTYKK